MIDRAYAACLAFADWCQRRRLSLLVIGAPVYLLILVGVGELVLQRFPNSGDEYAYLYQAATLAEGRLSNPAPPVPDAFAFNYITRRGDRVFSAFPPGWPLALTLAAALSVPAWLVNPMCGVLSLLLVWALASELHGDRIGPLAAAMVAFSGFFIFNAASYFSHTFCGLLLLLAAGSAAAAGRRQAAGPLLTGFFIGWAVLARYFTGSLCGIAIGALLVSRTRPHHLRALALVVAGGAPWLLFLLAYNAALSGTPWRLTTLDMTVSIWFARGFATRGLDILATQLLQFLLWTPPALLLAYLWFLRRATRCHGVQLLDWLFVATAVTLVFYVNRGGNQYGPRFYYEAFLFLVVFTAGQLFRADDLAQADRGTRRVFAAVALSVALVPPLMVWRAVQFRVVITERRDVFARVADEQLTDAIVLLAGRVGTARSMDARDLTRNGIGYSGSVLYALDRTPSENCALTAAYPRRSIYRYTWNPAERRGRLSPIPRMACPGTGDSQP
jgi:hypothetical protein